MLVIAGMSVLLVAAIATIGGRGEQCRRGPPTDRNYA